MVDVLKLVDELSSLTVLEAAELAKLLEDKWQPSKVRQHMVSVADIQSDLPVGRMRWSGNGCTILPTNRT
jgi:ribosomal protein L7/L12